MNNDEPNPSGAEAPDREEAAPEKNHPRGNPETDHESVKKGQEQLDKISGN